MNETSRKFDVTAASISGGDLGAFSAEVTATDKRSLEAAAEIMPRRMPIYIAALPRSAPRDLIEKAEHARLLGFDPIVHLVARNYSSEDEFASTLSELQDRAAITKALVLGGDRDTPEGPFDSALQLIETGLLPNYGVKGVSLACYPEGHPRISDEVLAQALHDKLRAAKRAGLAVRLVTQICFDADVILDFVAGLREHGIVEPLRVGVVGPAKITTLIKYAAACGVGPSLRSLAERAEMHKKLLSGYRPDDILDAISAAIEHRPELNIVGAHFFTFGSLKKSVEWMQSEPHLSLSFNKPPIFEWDG